MKITKRHVNSIKSKFIFLFSLITLSSFGIFYAVVVQTNTETLENAAYVRLNALQKSKANELYFLFSEITKSTKILAANSVVVNALKNFTSSIGQYANISEPSASEISEVRKSLLESFSANIKNQDQSKITDLKSSFETVLNQLSFHELIHQYLYRIKNPLRKDSSAWFKYHKRYQRFFKDFIDNYEYYDLFLIDAKSGRIVYSYYKEIDFSTNLLTGPFKNSILGTLYRKLLLGKKDEVMMIDLDFYLPSNNQIAGFIGAPIYDNDQIQGVLIIQIPTNKISNIATGNSQWESAGYGKTGESYLFGPDMLMRSQSRFIVEDLSKYLGQIKALGTNEKIIENLKESGSSILIQKVDLPASKLAMEGKTGGTHQIDYRGVETMAVYSPFTIHNINWGLIVQIDKLESLAPLSHLKQRLKIAAFLLFILSILAALFVGNWFSNPIIMVSNKMQMFADGNLELIAFDRKSQDEVGRMLVSINSSLQSLQNIFSEKSVNWQKIKEKIESEKRLIVALNEEKSSLQQSNEELHAITKQLQDSQLQLAEVSRIGGMAEMSTLTLHSIGNALCSMEIELVVNKEIENELNLIKLFMIKYSNHLSSVTQVDLEKISSALETISNSIDASIKKLNGNLLRTEQSIKLVRSSLDYNREYSRIVEAKMIVNLSSLLTETLNISNERLVTNNVELLVNIDNHVEVYAERHKLFHVILTILNNSIDSLVANNISNKQIKVSCYLLDRFVHVDIFDNGKGIPRESEGKVFGFGFTNKKNGTGLSLHHAANFVKSLGGEITFRNLEKQNGIIFTIKLPAKISLSA